MYGREALFVPGTRWGGVRKASTVWRQVATARARTRIVGCQVGARHPLRRGHWRFAWTDGESDH